MQAIILAAGQGARLRPLTDKIPKPLIKLNGKTLIEYHLEKLAKAGITDIVINTNHLGFMIQEYLGDGAKYKVKLKYSPETQILEVAGGIINALNNSLLKKSPFIVVNADIYTDYDFNQLKQINLANNYAHLLLTKNPEHNLTGDFCLASNLQLINKDQAKNLPSYTYSGMGIIDPKLFADFEPGPRKLLDVFLSNIAKDKISGSVINNNWFDIGTKERLQTAQDYFQNKLTDQTNQVN